MNREEEGIDMAEGVTINEDWPGMPTDLTDEQKEMLTPYDTFLLPHLRAFDIFMGSSGDDTRLMPLINSGQYVLQSDGIFRRPHESYDVDSPWIFVRPKMDHRCGLSMNVFQFCKVLPEPCLSCYKVTVKPRNVRELLMLLTLMETKTERECKCGTEERLSVHGCYGGYFYNETMEEGLNCLDEIKELVAKHISPDVPVFLKRGCTEMERYFGSPIEWDDICTPDMRTFYGIVERHFEVMKPAPTPHIIKLHKIHRWLLIANSIGDTTAFAFNEGGPFETPYAKYVRNVEDIPVEHQPKEDV